MLFALFNVLMLCVLASAAYFGWKWNATKRTEDASLTAVLAIASVSLFCAYAVVLGFATALSSFYDTVVLVVSFAKLLAHNLAT